MNSRERFETAWSFQEPDRVPIELRIGAEAARDPAAERVVELIEKYADNVYGASPFDWGFLGWESRATERVIERRPGEYVRFERVQETPSGRFVAVTRQPDREEAATDFHWEKRFISSPEDLERLLETAPRLRPVDMESYRRVEEQHGGKGPILVSLLHALGRLVRQADTEQVYMWFATNKPLIHRFLEVTTEFTCRAVEAIVEAGARPIFSVVAHEMFLPPWAGKRFFEEFVFPYDKRVNDVIHRHGGKLRIHSHGPVMEYLDRFAEMGVDALEPLEGPPFGDVDLAEAKRRVGDRMMLSGNAPSPHFPQWTPEQVRESVRQAVRSAAPGGGFSLRTTGGTAGTNSYQDREQLRRILENIEAYVLAGLEFGVYPIR